MKTLITISPEIQSGTPVFTGTRVPVNGELLTAMDEKGIEYLLTVDKNLQYQQNLEKFSVKVVVLFTYDNRFKTLSDKVALIEATINKSPDTDKIINIDLRNL